MFRTSSPQTRCFTNWTALWIAMWVRQRASNVRQLCKRHLAIECHFDLRLCRWHTLRRFQGTPEPVGIEKPPNAGICGRIQ